MHIRSRRVILVVSFGIIDMYMRRIWWETMMMMRVILVPFKFGVGIVGCREMGNGWRRHQVSFPMIDLIG